MNNTALGAESIIFISEAHEKFYYEKLKEVRYQDVYHKGNRQGYGWRKSIQMIIVGKIRVQSQHSEVQSQHFRI